MKKYFHKLIILGGAFFALFFYLLPVQASPDIANYYLGVLPVDERSLRVLSKTDLLIVSPDQFITRADVIAKLKKTNPKLVLLAYVPTESYNAKYWPDDLIFKNLKVRDEWWLRDREGRQVSSWPGLKEVDMCHDWSDYLVSFVNQHILNQPNVDGIFFDLVNDGISDVNHGDIYLAGASTATSLDAEWAERMRYLLSQARTNLATKYIVINGSSRPDFQPFVNGRMYETFPTPWEEGGSWSGLMTKLEKNKTLNSSPEIYVFNANSNNTGKENDYSKVRFGLASSLLTDHVYFGYDSGDLNHAQLWWYDEYDAVLGNPIGPAASQKGSTPYANDVWRRDFLNGLALVNPTLQSQNIDLGGEYEKLIGAQDPTINDGSIVDSVSLAPKDGLLLYKTFDNLSGVVYPNGTFFRFYSMNGRRVRNGFFAFDDKLPGGAKVFSGDLDSDGSPEKIVVSGPKVEVFDASSTLRNTIIPFGETYSGLLNISVAGGLVENKIAIAGSKGGEIQFYNANGDKTGSYFPLGKKYHNGFSVALGPDDSIFLGTGNKILIFDLKTNKIKRSFLPLGNGYRGPMNFTVGDFNGDGVTEIAVSGVLQKKPLIRIFSEAGKKLKEFGVKGLFGGQPVQVAAADLNGSGEALVLMTKN